jgi:hypothetical protein
MSVLVPARAPCRVFAGAVWLTREGGGVVNVRFVIVCDAAERVGYPAGKPAETVAEILKALPRRSRACLGQLRLNGLPRKTQRRSGCRTCMQLSGTARPGRQRRLSHVR